MKNIAFALICIVVFLSCKKTTPTTSTTTTDNVVTGNISGKTTQIDQYGNTPSSGLNGVTVSLDNSTVTAVTDNSGNYILQGVKPGVYTIFFNKQGCEAYEIQQVNFPGNGTLYENGYAVQKPTFQFASATAVNVVDSIFHQNRVKVTLNLSPNTNSLNLSYITGANNSIDTINPGQGSFYNIQIPPNTSTFTFNTAFFGFTSATGSYVKIYPYSGGGVSYHDYGTNSNKFLGYGTPLAAIKVN